MAGLIAANINKENPLQSVAGYDPERVTLDEDKDTVEGRVRGIIAKNSPLGQLNVTRSQQVQNQKGTLSSSMAIGAGQSALYDYAVPIASQDANTSFQTKALNQQAGNTALSQTAASQTQGALQERQGQQVVEQIEKQGVISREMAKTQAELDRTTQQQLESQRGENTLAQIQAQGGIQSQLQSEQGAISQQLQAQQIALQKEMQLAIQSNDIAAQRDIQARAAEIEKQLQEIRGQQALEQQAAGGDIQSRLQTESVALQREMQLALQSNNIAAQERIQNRQGQIDKELAQINATNQLLQIDKQGEISSRLQAEQGEIQSQLQTADAATRERLQSRQAEIDQMLQVLQGQQSLDQIGAQGEIQGQLQQQAAQLDEQIKLALQANDIAAQQNLQAQRAEIDKQLLNIQGQQSLDQIDANGVLQRELMREQGQINLQLQTADAATREALLVRQGEIDKTLANLQAANNVTLQNLQGNQQLEQIAAQASHNMVLQNAQNGFERVMQNLRGDQANELARINNASSELMQTNQSAAMIMATTTDTIGNILSNPDIPATSKQALVDRQMDMLETSLGVMGGISGIDLTGILDFRDGVQDIGAAPSSGSSSTNYGFDVPEYLTYPYQGRISRAIPFTNNAGQHVGGPTWDKKGTPPEGYSETTKDGTIRQWKDGKWVTVWDYRNSQ